MMTTVQITLPDALAQEAAQAGLLTPEKIERMLREQLRAERMARMKALRWLCGPGHTGHPGPHCPDHHSRSD